MDNKHNEKRDIDNKELNHELTKISEWLGEVRFRKQFIGGISEEDVWRKIEELNSMYEEALRSERIRYNTLLEHYKETSTDKQDTEKLGYE